MTRRKKENGAVTRVACVIRWRADTYLVNNARGMTGTAAQRPSLQPDTPVFRNTMIHRPNVLNASATPVHERC